MGPIRPLMQRPPRGLKVTCLKLPFRLRAVHIRFRCIRTLEQCVYNRMPLHIAYTVLGAKSVACVRNA